MNTKSLEERIRAAMIETYWEGISTDISNNNFDSTVQIITEIETEFVCLLLAEMIYTIKYMKI